jgi:hypothetical protein
MSSLAVVSFAFALEGSAPFKPFVNIGCPIGEVMV